MEPRVGIVEALAVAGRNFRLFEKSFGDILEEAVIGHYIAAPIYSVGLSGKHYLYFLRFFLAPYERTLGTYDFKSEIVLMPYAYLRSPYHGFCAV